MRQAIIASILSLGLLILPTSALADFYKGHSQQKFTGHHQHQLQRSVNKIRSQHRQQHKIIHQKLHRIEHHHHVSGHKTKYWNARGHSYSDRSRHHYNHYVWHNHRPVIKHRHHSHRRHDSDHLEWLGMLLLLDEALDDDCR